MRARNLIAICIALSVNTWDSSALAANTSKYSFFAGTGVGFSLPGPFRFRMSELEVGTYGPSFGIAKYFRKDQFYAVFGPAVGVIGRADLGIIASVGMEHPLFWVLGSRIDAYTFHGFSGPVFNGVTVGLSVNY